MSFVLFLSDHYGRIIVTRGYIAAGAFADCMDLLQIYSGSVDPGCN